MKKETYCYESLFEGELKKGEDFKLKTGITYADIKNYAKVSIVVKMASNDAIANNIIQLGSLIIGRFGTSGAHVLLDLRDYSFIEPWCCYVNTTITDVPGTVNGFKHLNVNYCTYFQKSIDDIEKDYILDTDEITFSNLQGLTLKVDCKIYIMGVTKYI